MSRLSAQEMAAAAGIWCLTTVVEMSFFMFSSRLLSCWASYALALPSLALAELGKGKGIRQKSRHHWQKTLSVTTFYSPLISSSSSFKWDFDLNFPLPLPYVQTLSYSQQCTYSYVSNGAKFEHRRLFYKGAACHFWARAISVVELALAS